MSTNYSSTIRRGHCTKHEEDCNTCVQCLWLKVERLRKERDAGWMALGRVLALWPHIVCVCGRDHLRLPVLLRQICVDATKREDAP